MENNKIYTVEDIAEVIEQIAPVSSQEEWDCSGISIGFKDSQVTKILTCLDVTEEVVAEAVKIKAEMIVSHHPLLFGGIDTIQSDQPTGKLVMALIKNEISVYSSHTPFDKTKGGNNDVLVKLLGLSSVKPLGESEICRVGKLKKQTSFSKVIEALADSLEMSIRSLRIIGKPDILISRVAVCTGAGSEFIEAAVHAGCELLVTGDVSYHDARLAEARDICIIDAGHYHTEKIFGKAMKEKLDKKLDGEVEVMVSEREMDPFKVL